MQIYPKGYRLDWAKTPSEALAKVSTETYDVCLVDYSPPLAADEFTRWYRDRAF